MVNFKENHHFSRFQGGPTFTRGGPTFSKGGGGSNCLFPIETHITCDFPRGGGSGPPVPPPLWIRTWPDNRDLHRIEQNSCLGGTKINKGCVVYLRNRSALAVNCELLCNNSLFGWQLLRRSNRVSACSQSLRFILSLRLYSSFIISRPGKMLDIRTSQICFHVVWNLAYQST